MMERLAARGTVVAEGMSAQKRAFARHGDATGSAERHGVRAGVGVAVVVPVPVADALPEPAEDKSLTFAMVMVNPPSEAATAWQREALELSLPRGHCDCTPPSEAARMSAQSSAWRCKKREKRPSFIIFLRAAWTKQLPYST